MNRELSGYDDNYAAQLEATFGHTHDEPEHAPVAWGRDESEPCQRGTYGCSVDHQPNTDYDCETW